MRNIFDYYKQSENQLTHALFSTLANDPVLLRGFIKDICKVRGLKKNLHLSVQSYPFARAYTNKEIESRSIPDAWIYNDDGFALVFEAKITDTLKKKQLTKHQKTAQKRGFETPLFYTITALPNAGDFENWTQITWVSIYKWLKNNETNHTLAKQAANYFELLEAQMLENKKLDNGNITTFTGFPTYEDGYSYPLAKSTLKKAMDVLHKETKLIKQLNVNPKRNSKRAIKGTKGKGVWDTLALGDMKSGKNVTKSLLHLTLGINETSVEPMLTIPHNLITYQKNKIKNRGIGLDGAKLDENLGKEKFIELCQTILNNMKDILKDNPRAQPILRGFQRRYPHLGSDDPAIDTLIETDLRTAFPGYNGKEYPKYQTQWLEVIYDVFCKKKQTTNYQVQIGIRFSYKKCPNLQKENALDLIARSWLACEPLISLCK